MKCLNPETLHDTGNTRIFCIPETKVPDNLLQERHKIQRPFHTDRNLLIYVVETQRN